MRKNGWVQKKSQGMFARWQSRFILHQAGTITLKHDPTESRCRLFDIVSAQQGPAETVITVNCKDGRKLLLKAATASERDDWLKAFQDPELPSASQRVSSPPLVNGTPSPTAVERATSARGEVAVISQAPPEAVQDLKSARGHQTPSAPERSEYHSLSGGVGCAPC
jgi:hypothetical protein